MQMNIFIVSYLLTERQKRVEWVKKGEYITSLLFCFFYSVNLSQKVEEKYKV